MENILKMQLNPENIVKSYTDNFELIKESNLMKAGEYIKDKITETEKLIKDDPSLGQFHPMRHISKLDLHAIRDSLLKFARKNNLIDKE